MIEPHAENPFNQIRVGLYDNAFRMTEPEFSETKTKPIRGLDTDFEVTAGPLIWGDQALRQTYCLEIHYSDSERIHRARLMDRHPQGTFGSYLYADMAEGAHHVAAEFCAENGFRVCNHLNSWPQFQTVLVRNPEDTSTP